MSSIRWSIGAAWNCGKGALAVAVGVYCTIAAAPSCQILSISWLARSSRYGHYSRGALIALVLTLTVTLLAGPIASYATQSIAQRLQLFYQDELLTGLTKLLPGEVIEPEVAASVQACRTSIPDVTTYVPSIFSAAQGVFVGVSLAATLWRIDPRASILVMCSLFPILCSYWFGAGLQNSIWGPVGREQRMNNYAVEQLIGTSTGFELSTMGSSGRVALVAHARLAEVVRMTLGVAKKFFVVNLLSGLASSVLLSLALSSILVRPGGTVAAAAATTGLLSGLGSMRQAGVGIGALISSAPTVYRYWSFVRPLLERTGGEVRVVRGGANELQAVSLAVSYPGGKAHALDGVSIRVRKGEIVALVGANGSGKTTLINALLGVVALESGKVFLDGVDLAMSEVPDRLSYFGVMPQEYGRYEFTLGEAVSLGRPTGIAVSEGEILGGLKEARFPSSLGVSLDRQLGVQFGGLGLSGGEWQRIALARMFLRDPAVWLLDEPTSAIDAATEERVVAELRASCAERITLVTSHRAWTLRSVDRIYVLDQGRVVEEGTFEQLASTDGYFASLFANQLAR